MTMSGDPEKDTAGDMTAWLEARPGWQQVPGIPGMRAKYIGSFPYADDEAEGQP